MRLIISEKNIAARRIAEILAVGKPTAEKVYSTPVYKFRRDGQDWVSIGLKGHIMKVDFPESVPDGDGREVDLRKWNLEALPTLVQAPIVKLDAEKGIIQSLKNLAKKADEVVIATDYDREGELIGADARAIVRSVNFEVPVHRARFSAITKGEIERAFGELGTVSDELAQAGEARQDIDLVWGAVNTRYLTLAQQLVTRRVFGDVLSAGRVQTPTLKLIVDREAERSAFVPEDYWTVKARFAAHGEEFPATHATDRFKEKAAAEKAMAAVASAESGTVRAMETRRRTSNPPAPFNTTSLMAAASSEGFTPAQTMRVAESLYMAGWISYPRVDNTVYPPSLDLAEILKTLSAVPAYHEYADGVLRAGPLQPTRGSKETTDHPPIHPTGAPDPEKLDAQAWRLYNLVSRRFMATLSKPAVLESTRVDIDVAGEGFVSRGDIVVVPGYRAIYPYGLKKEEQLPSLSEGEEVRFLGAEMDEKQTQPPARYSQGKLIQEMERLGLGTKATRHDIIQGLYDRKYVQNDPVEPTCKGMSVIEALTEYAERITTPAMTAELEQEMDAIANAKAKREDVVQHSRDLLGAAVATLMPIAREVGEKLKRASDEDAVLGKCPRAGQEGHPEAERLTIKYSPKTRSHFVGCSGYPECDVTFPLPKQAKFQAVEEACPTCGKPQVKVMQFKQRPRVICLDPACPTRLEPEVDVGPCPTGDGGRLVVRRSASTLKRFVRCTNYENCGTSYPLPQQGEIEATGETCDCGTPKVVVHTRKGPWKICVNPECSLKTDEKSAVDNGRSAKPDAAANKRRNAARKGAATRAAKRKRPEA